MNLRRVISTTLALMGLTSLLCSEAAAQPRAPTTRPLWYGVQAGNTAIYAYDPSTTNFVGKGCPSTLIPTGSVAQPSPYAMDPNYQSGYWNSLVQVDATQPPSFVRWGFPTSGPPPTPPCLTQVVAPGVSRVATQTVPLSMIIDLSQNMITLENYAPPGLPLTTWIGQYRPNALNPAVWTLVGGVSLGIALNPAWVTIDSLGTFWIVGWSTGQIGLWSWTIGAPAGPPVTTQMVQATERPSWITAERPNPALGYANGLIWITTWDPVTKAPFDLYVLNPPATGLVRFGGLGGAHVWPDTTLASPVPANSLGNGVWIGDPGSPWLVWKAVGSLACLTPLNYGNPTVLQMDLFTPAPASSFVVYGTNGGFGAGCYEYTQATCPAPFGPVANILPPPELRSTGWPYVEYVLTGWITRR